MVERLLVFVIEFGSEEKCHLCQRTSSGGGVIGLYLRTLMRMTPVLRASIAD